jgi:nicotinate phosphoribosyltransferase
MVDRSVVSQMGDFDPRGVNPQLVRNVRAALDAEGFTTVQITVSGGFDPAKIRRFESEGVPVDSYGVGSSLFAGQFDFTADIVIVDGTPLAKQGRRYRPNPGLERVS